MQHPLMTRTAENWKARDPGARRENWFEGPAWRPFWGEGNEQARGREGRQELLWEEM